MISNHETMRLESNGSRQVGGNERNSEAGLSPNAEKAADTRGKPIDVSDNEYWNYCDNCGTRLQTFRCRYVCPNCGFFHSCSEP